MHIAISPPLHSHPLTWLIDAHKFRDKLVAAFDWDSLIVARIINERHELHLALRDSNVSVDLWTWEEYDYDYCMMASALDHLCATAMWKRR